MTTTTDFIQACVNDKPTDVAKAFNSLMADKIDQMIDQKYTEISQNMFNQEGQDYVETE